MSDGSQFHRENRKWESWIRSAAYNLKQEWDWDSQRRKGGIKLWVPRKGEKREEPELPFLQEGLQGHTGC